MKQYALLGQTVNVGCLSDRIPITAHERLQIIHTNQHDIRSRLRLIALGLRMSAEQHRDQAHPQATSAATSIQVTADDVD